MHATCCLNLLDLCCYASLVALSDSGLYKADICCDVVGRPVLVPEEHVAGSCQMEVEVRELNIVGSRANCLPLPSMVFVELFYDFMMAFLHVSTIR